MMGSKSVKTNLIISISGSFVLVIAFVVMICIISLNTYFQSESKKELHNGITSFQTLLENFKVQALAQCENIAVNPEIIKSLTERNFNDLLQVSQPLMKNGKLDYMVFTDPTGKVILRTHEPDKIPAEDDSIINQVNVAKAAQGETFVGIEPGKVVRLSVRAGVPVYDTNKNLVGIVSTGYTISQNSIVDMGKKLIGCDYTIYYENAPVATTFMDQSGQRISESFASDGILEQASSSLDSAIKTETVLGQTYHTQYKSIIGANEKPIGIIAASISKQSEEKLQNDIVMKLILSSIIILIVIFFGGLVVSSKISHLVFAIQNYMLEAGNGDLRVKFAINSRNEIGIIKAAINNMVSKQSDFLLYITEAGLMLKGSATKLADTNVQITAAINDIADHVQNVSTKAAKSQESIIEVSEVVDNFSDLIKNAQVLTTSTLENSQSALSAAHGGNKVIEEAQSRIRSIEEKTQYTETQIMELKQYSEQIAIISDTINSIADQTNLLSLNASIEAARAGEAGKGFTVVATEVRKLAEQSTKGAEDVADLVRKILEATNVAVDSTYQSRIEAQAGVNVISKAREAFEHILETADSTAMKMNEIVKISNEEAEGTQRIIASVKDVVQMMQETTHNAHEVAAATEEIAASMDEVNNHSANTSELANTLQERLSTYILERVDQTNDKNILEKVKSDHFMFVVQLDSMLKGNENTSAGISEHTQCRFGKWYYREGNNYTNNPVFREIEEPHRKLHEYAKLCAESFQAGNVKAAKKYYLLVRKYSFEIVRLLDELGKQTKDK